MKNKESDDKEALKKRILKTLSKEEIITAGFISKILNKHPYQISNALLELKEENIVEKIKSKGKYVFWRLKNGENKNKNRR